MTEAQLIRKVLSGDTSAFGYFVDNYQNMAITIAYRIIGNMQDAEDVVQDSYIRAFRNLHTFRADSKFSSWLYRIVYNAAVSFSKTRIWIDDSNSDLLKLSSEPNFTFDENEMVDSVDKILDLLSKGDALILTLFYLEDHSVKDIALITGLSESNVKVKLFRARKSFRDIWMSYFGEEPSIG